MSVFRFGPVSSPTRAAQQDHTPFCTSPSQLHEVTLGDTLDGTLAITKAASPIRGRTMKEYEEQLGSLKKENFNLKLRIYFLEERMGKLTGIKDKEEAIKNNIELKVETEALRKELAEKQELLVQAAKALDLLEEQHTEEKRRHGDEKGMLESRIQELEKEIRDYEVSVQQLVHLPRSSLTQSQISQASQDSQDSQYSSAAFEVEHLAAQVQELTEQQELLETQLREKSDHSKRLQRELLQSESQCKKIQSDLDCFKDVMIRLEKMLDVPRTEVVNKVKQLKKSEQKLQTSEQMAEELHARLVKQAEAAREAEEEMARDLKLAEKEVEKYSEEVKTLKELMSGEKSRSRDYDKCKTSEEEARAKLQEAKKTVEELRSQVRDREVEIRDLTSALVIRDAKLLQLEKDYPLALRSIHGLLTRVKDGEKEREKLVAELKRRNETLAQFESRAKEAKQEQWRQSMDQGYEQDILCQLQNLQATLREKEVQLVVCEQRLEIRDNQVRELQAAVESLKKEIADRLKRGLNDKPAASDEETRGDLLQQLEEKKRQVDSLNRELQKRTYNLQELVNKELWDKNKQIEKLELRLSSQASLLEQQEKSLDAAKQQLASRGIYFRELTQADQTDATQSSDAALKLANDDLRYLTLQVEQLKERLRNTPERDNETRVMQTLRTECEHLKKQLEEARCWRLEACGAISALRCRLEELASFLSELLLHSDGLTGLPAERQHVLRAVINQSLELSHTIANLSGGPLQPTEMNADLTLDALILTRNASSRSLCDLSNLEHCSVEVGQPLLIPPRCHPGPKALPASEAVSGQKAFLTSPESESSVLVGGPLPTDSADETQLGQELSCPDLLPVLCQGVQSVSLRSTDCSDGATHLSTPVPRRHSDGSAGTSLFEHNLPSPVHSTKSMPARPRCRSRSSNRASRRNPAMNCVAFSVPTNCVRNPCGSQTDSESWSEPDRSVSQARMGLQDESLRTHSLTGCSASPTVRAYPGAPTKTKSTSSSNGTDQGGRRHGRRSRTESVSNDVRRLTRRMQILEDLNEALRTELHIFNQIASSKPTSPGKAVGESSRRAIIALQEQVSLLETRLQERENELLERQCALLEVRTASETKALEAEERLKQAALSQTKLEDKLQELSVQVLEVEVRREQAEQEAERAAQECERLRAESQQELTSFRARLQDALKTQADLQEQLSSWKRRADAAQQEAEDWKNKTRSMEQAIQEAETRLNAELKEKAEICEQLKSAESQADEWRTKLAESERRWKENAKVLEEQLKSKEAELDREKDKWTREMGEAVERRAKELEAERKADMDKRLLEAEQGLKSRLDSLERRAGEAAAEAEQRTHELEERYKAQECALKARLTEVERRARADECELRRQLDETSVAASAAQLEQARLANERLQLEQQTRRLQSDMARERRAAEDRFKLIQEQLTAKIHSLTQTNAEFYSRVKELERELSKVPGKRRPGSVQSSLPSSPEGKVLTEITNLCRQRSTDMSDYVSEEVETDQVYHVERNYGWASERIPVNPAGGALPCGSSAMSSVGTRGSTASPDLGIESDQGRVPSQECHPLKKSTTAPCVISTESLSRVLDLRRKQQLDYCDLEQENLELKQRLQQTRQTLEQAYAQLAASNQRKRQVEKAICKQLHKTHHLLRNARSNLENPSSVSNSHDDSLVLVEVQVSRADQLATTE